ncbi:MAG: molybdopterin-dependent oxidoreductase [Actinomycetota bacterium]|nr:molybdopterin-dependent oxidoreductase [Actinomycetota bacterium]
MKKEIALTINDNKVSAPEGTLIIEAAESAGIDIPHLCYCESLASTGACRVCMVEVEGARGLVASCTQKIKEGMKVTTDSEKVRAARRFVVDLILSNHPGDCLSCDKNGVCELQKYAYELEIDKTSFSMKDQGYELDRENPFIERNYNLCILCGRCVRICKKQSEDVIDFVKRGMLTKVSTPMDIPLTQAGCDFCGSCLAVCPTAALMEKERRFKGREWEMASAKTTCSYCGAGCRLTIDSVGGELVRARAEEATDFICSRGRFGFDFAGSDKLITKPLIKKDGAFTEATYDEAVKFIASRLKEIKKAHSEKSIGGFIGGAETNETIYLFQKFLRAGLGTNNVDSSARLLGMPALIEMEGMLASDAFATFDDLEEADFVIALGSGMAAHPKLLAALRRVAAKGGKVALLGARPLDKRFSNLTITAGSEEFALSAIIKALLSDEALAKEAEKMAGFKELKKSLSGLDEKTIEKETSLKAEQFSAIASNYLTAKAPKIAFCPEKLGLHAMELMADILILTSNFKSSVLASLALANLRGAAELGALAGFYPGLLRDGDDLARVKESYGGKLPKAAESSIGEMLGQMGSTLLAMYIIGEDPPAHLGDKTEAKKALSSLDLLVVQDSFMTELTELADVVLPKRTPLEEEGTYISYGASIVEVHPAKESDLKATAQVIADLSGAMGHPMKYSSIKDITKELKTFIPSPDKGKGQVPSLTAANPTLQGEGLDKAYPYALMVETGKFGFYDKSRTDNSKLSKIDPAAALSISISKADGVALNLCDGDEAKIESRRAQAQATVRIDESLPAGAVSMAEANEAWALLASGNIDAKLKVPEYNLFAVKISKGGDVS